MVYWGGERVCVGRYEWRRQGSALQGRLGRPTHPPPTHHMHHTHALMYHAQPPLIQVTTWSMCGPHLGCSQRGGWGQAASWRSR